MKNVMISKTRQTLVCLCAWTCLGLVALAMIFIVNPAFAQVFEEMPLSTPPPKTLRTEIPATQQLPTVAAPGDANVPPVQQRTQRQNFGVIQPVGGATRDGGVVLAQYQDEIEWSPSQAVLPSIRLVQGEVPRLASIEKATPRTSTYQGPGKIMSVESDGTTPTITTRPTPRLPGPPPVPAMSKSQRPPLTNGIVNAYTQPEEEIDWNDTAWQEGESYETLPSQLGRGYSSAYTSQDLYGMPEYSGQPGGQFAGNIVGQGFANEGISAANGYYGYGQGMYGYGYGGYGGYPGTCPAQYGLFSGIFSPILCSNAWENLTVGIGGAGFKSPLDFRNGGAFGFTETLNWASPSTCMFPVRLQAGVRAVQAYPSGYRDDYNAWQRNAREQYFGTVGVFKRNIGCSPLSFGAAYDVMSDDYYDKYKLEQLRAELSCGSMYGVEFGYRGAFGLRNDSFWLHNHYTGLTRRAHVQVTDYHTLFIKKYFSNGGEGSLAGGATEYGDVLVRAEYSIPLSNEWGLKNSLSYLVPRGGHSPVSPSRESWDISLQLVYQPSGSMLAGFCNPFRAFFDVADNGTLWRRFK